MFGTGWLVRSCPGAEPRSCGEKCWFDQWRLSALKDELMQSSSLGKLTGGGRSVHVVVDDFSWPRLVGLSLTPRNR